jgi:hypothetical protein
MISFRKAGIAVLLARRPGQFPQARSTGYTVPSIALGTCLGFYPAEPDLPRVQSATRPFGLHQAIGSVVLSTICSGVFRFAK